MYKYAEKIPYEVEDGTLRVGIPNLFGKVVGFRTTAPEKVANPEAAVQDLANVHDIVNINLHVYHKQVMLRSVGASCIVTGGCLLIGMAVRSIIKKLNGGTNNEN